MCKSTVVDYLDCYICFQYVYWLIGQAPCCRTIHKSITKANTKISDSWEMIDVKLFSVNHSGHHLLPVVFPWINRNTIYVRQVELTGYCPLQVLLTRVARK